MTIPLICLFIAGLFLMLSKIPVGIAMYQQCGRYNNVVPRKDSEKLTGWGFRAWCAHQNMFESFMLFSAGVLVAHITAPDSNYAAILSVVYIVSRLLYEIAYLSGLSIGRTVIWMVAYFSSLALILTPVFA